MLKTKIIKTTLSTDICKNSIIRSCYFIFILPTIDFILSIATVSTFDFFADKFQFALRQQASELSLSLLTVQSDFCF